jgi:hypothetical protein
MTVLGAGTITNAVRRKNDESYIGVVPDQSIRHLPMVSRNEDQPA